MCSNGDNSKEQEAKEKSRETVSHTGCSRCRATLAYEERALLPCPLCGGKVEPCDCGTTCSIIVCPNCGVFEMNVPDDTTGENVVKEAVKAFNKRKGR